MGRTIVMRRRWLCLLTTAAALLLALPALQSQGTPPKRKITLRTAAEYPTLARSLALEGIVKVDALVAADGTVLAGQGPLLWLVAAQLIRAGAPHSAILLTAPHRNYHAAIRFLLKN